MKQVTRKTVFFFLIGLVIFVGAARSRETAVAQQQQPNSPQIIGGEEAEPGAWPWMAALVSANVADGYDGQFCGGALIAPTWVLTAGHCTENTMAQEVDVVLGRHELDSDVGERIGVAEIINHPGYNPGTLDNDFALLRLETASGQTAVSLVGPTTLNLTTPGVEAIVTGWGNTSTNGSSFPNGLRQVMVPLISNPVCNQSQSYGGAITENMLCAGYAQGGRDSCQGDSGGPLVVPDGQGGWAQAGVVSWGYGCAEPDLYGVYARVSRAHSWIAEQIGTTPPTLNHKALLPFLARS